MRGRVILAGGYKKAASLAASLIKQGYHVTAVNMDKEHCLKLAEIDKLNVINGDGTRPFVLEEAGAMDADIVIALTNKDADNLVICQLSKKRFRVHKAVSLLADNRKTEFFHRMGIDSVVCATNSIAAIIEHEALLSEMESLPPVIGGKLRITQVTVTANSPAAGKIIRDLTLPGHVIIGCILRGERPLVPRGDTRIVTGDVLTLISSLGGADEAVAALTAGRDE